MQQPLAPAPNAHMSQQDAASSAEQTLRAHLLPHIGNSNPAAAINGPVDNKISADSVNSDMNIDPAISGAVASVPPHPPQVQLQSHQGVPNPHPQTAQQMQAAQAIGQHQNLQMSVSPVMSQGITIDQSQSHSGAEDTNSESQPKQRGGKRELSTSKRAAQNRAAQRAFRQRKEGYIKKLEEQVRDFSAMQESYKQIQAENYQLRDYIISLQSRVIESQGEEALPPAPVSLVHPSPTIVSMDPNMNAQSSQGQITQVHQSQHLGHATHVSQIPQQPPIAAPTANMGMIAQSHGSNHTITSELSTGQKRPHNDSEALLQSIAQAAGHTTSTNVNSGNHYVTSSQSSTTVGVSHKSNSPVLKRVKGEHVEQLKSDGGLNNS